VTADTLSDLLWDGGQPPARHHAALLNYVSRLRRELGPGLRSRIETRPPGYAISIRDDDEFDLWELTRLSELASASALAGDWEQAGERARRALALWRDEPLCDVPAAGLHAEEIPRLAELRLRLSETLAGADLHAGHHDAASALLRDLARAHPLRERLHEWLMLSLYLAGRRADALDAYQRARRTLASDLGVEPGERLRSLHQRILAADPRITAADSGLPPGTARQRPAATAGRRFPSGPVPRQLPVPPAHFLGRAAELAALTALLGDGTERTVTIATISGAAGVGKSSLALHWAHQVAERFPDCQLYASLRGFSPAGHPAPAADILGEFLDALGVPPAQAPATLEAQAALYRSLVAGQRMLLVLDNARDAAQVRPLLPGSPRCLTVVTSRHKLTSLVAAEGAHPLVLDPFTGQEAWELLSRRVGRERVEREPAAAAELINLSTRLPLALSIAAAHAATRPTQPLAALMAQLRSARSRLDMLDTGEETTNLRAVFSWSYRQLSPAGARMFRLLGLHSGPDISLPAAASLAADDRATASGTLTELTSSSLVTERTPGRFSLHDLLHDYAAEQVRAHDDETARRAARRRLLDHYLHSACAAARLLHPTRDPIHLPAPASGTLPERPGDTAEAWAWYDTERPVLLAAVESASATGFGRHAWQLPWALDTFLNRRGYWQDRLTAQRTALSAAQRLADPVAQAHAHDSIAAVCIQLGSHGDARAHLLLALSLHNDPARQARTHLELSSLAEKQHQTRAALGHAEQALTLYRAAGHENGEAVALAAVGWCHTLLGQHEPAIVHCQQALARHRRSGDEFGQAHALDSLGHAHHHLGRHTEAVTCYREAVALFTVLGHRYNQASALNHLGDTHHATGDLAAARQAWQEAVAILEDLGHPEAGQVRTRLAAVTSPRP
jgi:DNA-binding SARP family transcriptional activator